MGTLRQGLPNSHVFLAGFCFVETVWALHSWLLGRTSVPQEQNATVVSMSLVLLILITSNNTDTDNNIILKPLERATDSKVLASEKWQYRASEEQVFSTCMRPGA